jgi:hypothetical protein
MACKKVPKTLKEIQDYVTKQKAWADNQRKEGEGKFWEGYYKAFEDVENAFQPTLIAPDEPITRGAFGGRRE